MNRTKIEWTDYTINPVKGKCPVACPYCYARKMYDRFKWNPELRFDPTVFNNLPTKPAKVFVGSTMELFLPECQAWLEKTFDLIKPYKWLTFQFLTKQSQNLIKWSPFPDNCWVGVTATNQTMFLNACSWFERIKTKMSFISIEPLLSWGDSEYKGVKHSTASWLKEANINWVIIGGMSGSKPFYPPEEWIEEIEQAADKAGIPVFEKYNLKKVWDKPPRQEMPNK